MVYKIESFSKVNEYSPDHMNYRERPFDFMGAACGVGLQDDFLPQHDLVFLVLIEYNTKCTILDIFFWEILVLDFFHHIAENQLHDI